MRSVKRPEALKKGEVYHVFNQGVGKQDVFLEEKDCDRMMVLLYLCNAASPLNLRNHFARGMTYADLWEMERAEPVVEIGAWCLMPDRFHLLLREIKKGGISQYMLKLTTAYSMYFNKKMARNGPLFRSPYRSELVEKGKHLNYVYSFIHLNPIGLTPGEELWAAEGVKNLSRARTILEKYPYSSLADYAPNPPRPQVKILQRASFAWEYDSIANLNNDFIDWMSYSRTH